MVNFPYFICWLITLALFWAPIAPYALPSGGIVTEGDTDIEQIDDTTLNVTQRSAKTVIDWGSFNINTNELTKFIQPSSNAIALNRIRNGNATEILGQLQANGKVFIINPNGVIFGHNSVVDVSGLVASTADMTNDRFMNSTDLYQFDRTGLESAKIINNGSITVKDGGLVALVAPGVENNGVITARLGKIALASGESFTLDLYGDQLVSFNVSENALPESVVKNTGELSADGGLILLSAAQASSAINSVVNMEGYVHANSISEQNGRIILGTPQGGLTKVNGTLEANGVEAGETGGYIAVLGDKVLLDSAAKLDASGYNGGGEILVGGDYQGTGDTQTASVTAIKNGATLNVNANEFGNGGRAIIWADDTTRFYGNITANGGAQSGNGGFVEVSGKKSLVFAGDVTTTATNGETGMLLLDPTDIIITDGGPDTDDAEISDGTILQGEGGLATFNISENSLEALAAGTNIRLLATNDITINDLSDNTLTLTTTGTVAFTADADNDGSGDFTMNAGDTIVTDGASVSITAANMNLGGINTSSTAGGDIILDANTGLGTVTLNNDFTTNTGEVTVTGVTTLAGNVVVDTGAAANSDHITFNQAISGDFNLTVDGGGAGNLTFNTFDINQLIINGGGFVTLGAGTYETDLALNFTGLGAITLGGNTTFLIDDAGTKADLTFGGANSLNGGSFDIIMTADTITADDIGNSTVMNSVVMNADTSIILNAPIITSGLQTYNADTALTGNLTTSGGPITIAGDASIGANLTTVGTAINITGATTLTADSIFTTGAGGGNIVFGSTVNGGTNLTLNAGIGDITTAGVLGGTTPLTSLTATASNLDFSDGVITTGAQTYNGATSIGGTFTTTNSAVNFNSPTTLVANTSIATNGGSGDVIFNDILNGTFNLGMTTGTGNVTFNGVVGGLTPLNNITGSGTTVALNTINTVGTQSYSGSLALNGDLNVSNGPLTLTGNVSLAGDSVLTSGGNVTQDITITGALTGDNTLTLVAGSADINLNGIDVDTLTLTSGVALNLGGSVISDTALDFTNVGAITITADATIQADDAGTASNITLDAANAIDGSGFDLTIDGDTLELHQIASVQNLIIVADTAGNLNDTITTTASQGYTGTFNTSDNITTSGASTIAFNNTLNTNAAVNITSAGGAIALNTTTASDNLQLLSNGGNITTTGTTNVTGTLTAASGAGSINLAATTTSGNTTLTSTGSTITTNDIASGGTLNIASNGAVILNGTTSSGGTFNINSSDNTITSNGAITLGGAFTTNSTNANQTYNGTINGAQNWTATAGAGTFTASDIIGGTTPLADFTVTAAQINLDAVTTTGNQIYNGTVDANGLLTAGNAINVSGDVDLDGGLSTSNGALTITGNATLTGDSVLVSGGTVGDDITIGGNVTGDFNLAMQAGAANTIMSGNVDINNWSFISGNQLTLGGSNYEADTGINFSNAGNIILTQNTAFNARDGATRSDITTDASNIITGNFDLSVFGDNVILNQIGNQFGGALNSLTVDANNVQLLGAVVTIGEQTYTSIDGLANDLFTSGADITFNTALNLLADVTLDTGSGDGDILFSNPIDGTFNLTINAGTGAVTALRDIGTTTPLQTFTANGANISIQSVATIGAQSYTGPTSLNGNLSTQNANIGFTQAVNLSQNAAISTGSGAGNITFSADLNGTFDLNITSGTGDISFANLGDTTRLGALNILSGGDIDFNNGAFVSSFSQSTGSGDINFGLNPGLNSLGSISVVGATNIFGFIKGGETVLSAVNHVNAVIDVKSLTIGGNSSLLQGFINGITGREAARRAVFKKLTSGPHILNSYTLPLLEMVSAPQTLVLTAMSDVGAGVSPFTVNFTEATRPSLNPFTTYYDLIDLEDPNIPELAHDYFEGDLFDFLTSQLETEQEIALF